MRRVTKDPWFGPKRSGWGWRPLTWQGWLVSLVLALLLVGARRLFGGSATGIVALAALVAAFALVAVLTGGRPGRSGPL